MKVQIPEEKASFPFSMIEGMMPLYPWIAIMGWGFVLVSLLIGIFSLAPAVSTFFSDSKAVREAAEAGSAFVSANVTAHVIESWVPSVQVCWSWPGAPGDHDGAWNHRKAPARHGLGHHRAHPRGSAPQDAVNPPPSALLPV